MNMRANLLIALGVFAVMSAAEAQGPWRDPSSHKVALVAVDDGVEIEVLDFGGSGRTILLLAGLGDTAHVFDDFAPRLTSAGFHVYSMTRRGFGASSSSATGYTVGRLAADVVAIIEKVSMNRPIVVGHSIAGEELNVLGREHASRIAGLVYLDAAVNRTRTPSADYQRTTALLPPVPQPTAEELRSYTTLLGYFARTRTAARPEGEVRATRVIGSDGSIGAPRPMDTSVRQAITAMLQKPEPPQWDRLQVPALAVFPVPASSADLMMPWYDATDPTLRANVATMYSETRARATRWAEEFNGSVRDGRSVEVPGGSHHVFLSKADDTARVISGFASTLASIRSR